MPNVLVLVLRPKGQLGVADQARHLAPDGVTELGGRWRVIELWKMPAEPVLATADPGLMPWVPLMQAAEPPEVVLRRCREVIDEHARADDHDRLITVTKVYTRLRYTDPDLLSILGRSTDMTGIDHALALGQALLLRDAIAAQGQKDILKVLQTRFGPVPPELEAEVKTIRDESVLGAAVELAASSPDLDHFAAALRAIPRPTEPWDPANEPDPGPDESRHPPVPDDD